MQNDNKLQSNVEPLISGWEMVKGTQTKNRPQQVSRLKFHHLLPIGMVVVCLVNPGVP